MTTEQLPLIESEPVYKCADCTNILTEDDTSTNCDDARICESCRENYCTCEACDTVIHSDDMLFGDDSCFCQSCYEERFSSCDHCSEGVLTTSAYTDSNGTCLCQRCYENHDYNTCQSCDAITRDCSYCESCDVYVCSDCYSEHRNHDNEEIDLIDHACSLRSCGSDAITDYHPDVTWTFHADKTDLRESPHFGVELEIETGENTSKCCKVVGNSTLSGRCLCSHDGSLNDGFEIITTPHKRQAFKKLHITKLLKELSANGATSHEKGTCGLHVHIERKGFLRKERLFRGRIVSNAVLYQMIFNQMSSSMTCFSRRKEDQIDNFCSFTDSEVSRYCAVNLVNRDTIEIRLWRGTLEANRFRASILMSLAALDFLKSVSAINILRSNRYHTQRTFTEWLSRQDEYQFLIKYLTKHHQFNF